MANKFPLILNTSANQIQEIASGDNLDLTGCKIVGLDGINSAGIVTFTKAHVGAATTWGEDLVVTGNARVTGILTVGTNSVTISGNDVNITGVTTASNFKTGTSNLHNVGIELAGINVLGADTPIGTGATIYNSGAAVFTGIVTATNYVGTINTPAQPNITSVGTLSSLDVSGNVSIGGTLTYEDVTNIDSVGLITARNGIDVDGHTNLDNVSIAGVVTFTGASYNAVWDKAQNRLEFADNAAAMFGTDEDLLIYNNNSNSFIDHSGAGNLQIRTLGSAEKIELLAAGHIDIKTASGNKNSIVCSANYGVDLYYNNSPKIQTTNAGANIQGICTATTFSGAVDATTGAFSGDATFNGGSAAVTISANSSIRLNNGSWTGDYTKITHHDNKLFVQGGTAGIRFRNVSGSRQLKMDNDGHFGPDNGQTYNLGSTSHRWANIYGVDGSFTGNVNTGPLITATGTEGISASLYLIADDGDDNGDGWRINSNQDDNDLTISNNISGSYVDKLTLTHGGALTFTGNLTLGSGTSSYITMNDSDQGSRQIHCNSDRIGFLKADGNWGAYSNDDGTFVCENNLIVNGGNSSTITMGDADEGSRQIHTNSNNIGFLTAAGSWAARCNDAGQWQCLQGLNVTGAGVVSTSLAVGSASLQNGAVASFKGHSYNQVNIAHSSNSSWGLLLANSDSTSNGGYHVSTSGNNNSCAIINVNNDALHLGTNNTLRWTINHDGHLICGGNGNLDIGGASNRVRFGYFSQINASSTITTTNTGNAIIIENSGGLKLCVTADKTVNMDARANSGSAAVLHKWNSPNVGGGSYEPYEEKWYDGDSYHSIKCSNNQFVFDSAIDAPHISSTSATITLGSNLSSGTYTTLINTGVLTHNYMYAVKIFWHYQGNGGTPFYALAGFFFCPASANHVNGAGRVENLVTSCHVGGDYYLKVRSKMSSSSVAGLEVAHMNWTAQANSTFTVTYKRIF